MIIRGQTVYPPKERIERLSIPEPNSGCWIWIGTIRPSRSGILYGRLIAGSRSDGTRKNWSAHRYSYSTFKGSIPEGLCVCHHCDNGLCVNPDHLFVGTQKDNSDDRDRKGRLVPAPISRGELHHSAKYSDEQINDARISTLNSRAYSKLTGMSDGYVRQIRRGKFRISPPKPLSYEGEQS